MQSMIRKPIEEGIKVFAICCAKCVILQGFKVYWGASVNDDYEYSGIAVVQKLLQKAYLDKVHGCSVYTDNWYITIKLARWLINNLGWYFCGTIYPTKN